MSDTGISLPSSNAELCLACCGSLPPTASERKALFFTSCCRRPICQRCLISNPRLSRFNPCLACLTGVRAVARDASYQRATSSTTSVQQSRRHNDAGPNVRDHGSLASGSAGLNIDGSLRDEDVFILGDDEGGDESDTEIVEEQKQCVGHSGGGNCGSQDTRSRTPPPAYTESDVLPQTQGLAASPTMTANGPQLLSDDEEKSSLETAVESKPGIAVPNQHIIQRSDTLLGIALKYGIDALTLCKLNNLPPSTLRMTPQLLHTRSYLTLPPTAKVPSKAQSILKPATDEPEDPEWARRRAMERAAKRFQLVTKEEDWRIANAYVAIASSQSASTAGPLPDKEKNELRGRRASSSVLTKRILSEVTTDDADDNRASASTTAQAVDAYLDDDEWEAEQIAAGRRPPSTYSAGSKSQPGTIRARLANLSWSTRAASSREKQA